MKLTAPWLGWPQTKKLINAFAGENTGKIRFVGGAVRDSLLGIEVCEVDAATTLTPSETIQLLASHSIRAIPTGIAHGTITAAIDGKNFEITTLRKDTACDGRHAEVAFGTDWQEDAARRDFTINALYLSAEGEVFDYFNGIEDLKAGNVRFIGDAEKRVQEDYLRILRFFRFFARYGKLEADSEALAACQKFASRISGLSGERIQSEMLKLLSLPTPAATISLMNTYGILPQVFAFDFKQISNISALDKLPFATCRLAFLLVHGKTPASQNLETINSRWKLSRKLEKELAIIIENIDEFRTNLTTAEQKKLIRKLGAAAFIQTASTKAAFEAVNQGAAEKYQQMLELAKNWQAPTLPVSGSDLLSIDIPAGTNMGNILKNLENYWEENDYQPSKEELLELARNFSI